MMLQILPATQIPKRSNIQSNPTMPDIISLRDPYEDGHYQFLIDTVAQVHFIDSLGLPENIPFLNGPTQWNQQLFGECLQPGVLGRRTLHSSPATRLRRPNQFCKAPPHFVRRYRLNHSYLRTGAVCGFSHLAVVGQTPANTVQRNRFSINENEFGKTLDAHLSNEVHA